MAITVKFLDLFFYVSQLERPLHIGQLMELAFSRHSEKWEKNGESEETCNHITNFFFPLVNIDNAEYKELLNYTDHIQCLNREGGEPCECCE